MDILTYGLLNKKVEEAKNVSGEKITEAVNTYLDKNPVAVGATLDENGVLYFLMKWKEMNKFGRLYK